MKISKSTFATNVPAFGSTPANWRKLLTKIKTTVGIEKNGRLTVNDQTVNPSQLESLLKASLAISPDKPNPTITIAAEVGVPFEQVTKVMAVANRLKARTILATSPKE